MVLNFDLTPGSFRVKGVPQAKVMSLLSGSTGIAKFAAAAPLMTAVQGAVTSKVVAPAKVVPPRRHYYSWCHPPCHGDYSIKKISFEGLTKPEN